MSKDRLVQITTEIGQIASDLHSGEFGTFLNADVTLKKLGIIAEVDNSLTEEERKLVRTHLRKVRELQV